jgi:hypothetical protein
LLLREAEDRAMSCRSPLRFGLATLALAAATVPPPPPDADDVDQAPPAFRTEVVPVAPGPDHVRVNGWWNWGPSRTYVWVPGTWRRPPHAKARRVKPEWRHAKKGWCRVDGHWR